MGQEEPVYFFFLKLFRNLDPARIVKQKALFIHIINIDEINAKLAKAVCCQLPVLYGSRGAENRSSRRCIP